MASGMVRSVSFLEVDGTSRAGNTVFEQCPQQLVCSRTLICADGSLDRFAEGLDRQIQAAEVESIDVQHRGLSTVSRGQDDRPIRRSLRVG